MTDSLPKNRPRTGVLLTGFDPFGEDRYSALPQNPSWLAVSALHGECIAGRSVVSACLPTVFDASAAHLKGLLRRHRPELVICVGQAGGRSALSLERIAININDARIADNVGNQPIDTPIVKRAPAAYFSTLPIKSMRRALQQAGLPVEISQTAGTFVCNHVFFALMHALAHSRVGARARGGFIHVPWLPQQGTPSLPLETLIDGLRLAIACALETGRDIAEEGGAID